jgi:hypothetical protein
MSAADETPTAEMNHHGQQIQNDIAVGGSLWIVK